MRPNTVPALLSAAALAATTLVALPAQAGFLARNGMGVERMSDGTISVEWRGKSGAPYFWCAVGDYVIRGLDMAPNTRIWRVSPPPRPAGAGVVFSLSPEGSAGKTGMLTIPDDGSLTAASAQDLCDEYLLDRN